MTTVSVKRFSPLKSIRQKCLDCCCSQHAEVRRCMAEECPLHPYRMGRNPSRAGIGGKPQERPEITKKADSQRDSEEVVSKLTDYFTHLAKIARRK
jgi:hypothetical protein